MAGSDKLYFWKRRNLNGVASGKRTPVLVWIILGLVLVLSGTGAAYYYLIWQPEQERLARLEAEKAARQQKINAIETFYKDSLAGGSIADVHKLFEQLRLVNHRLAMLGFSPTAILCKNTDCSLSYQLDAKRIFTLTDIDVWGESYSPSFSKNSLDYSGIPSRLNNHPWLNDWKNKKPVELPVCTDVLSYLSTWNSLGGNNTEIVMQGFPVSAVENDESALKNAVMSFGMMFATWTITIPSEMEMTRVSVLLQKQQFADAFIIKSIEFKEKSTLVTGGLACKKGN